MGYSRQQFYEIRRNFQTYGAEGLLDRVAGARAPHPNRVSAEIERAILDHALVHPCHGPLRVAQELMLRAIQVSAARTRAVPWPAAPLPRPSAKACPPPQPRRATAHPSPRAPPDPTSRAALSGDYPLCTRRRRPIFAAMGARVIRQAIFGSHRGMMPPFAS
jgi:hypothetical protein